MVKKVPINISYTIIVHAIDGYLDSRISPSYVIYIITREKQLSKKKIRNISQGGDFHKLIKNLMGNG